MWSTSLIVDDIIDNDSQRAGLESAWSKFGKEEAFDCAQATCKHLFSNLCEKVSPMSSLAASSYVELAMNSLEDHKKLDLDSPLGKFYDNYVLRQDFCCAFPVDAIFEFVGTKATRELARNALREVTLAGQILNDLKDFLPRYGWIRANFSDLRNKLVTIPIRILFENLNCEDKERLRKLYNQSSLIEENDQLFIFESFRKNDSLHLIVEMTQNLYGQSLDKFSTFVTDQYQFNPIQEWVNYKLSQCKAIIQEIIN